MTDGNTFTSVWQLAKQRNDSGSLDDKIRTTVSVYLGLGLVDQLPDNINDVMSSIITCGTVTTEIAEECASALLPTSCR